MVPARPGRGGRAGHRLVPRPGRADRLPPRARTCAEAERRRQDTHHPPGHAPARPGDAADRGRTATGTGRRASRTRDPGSAAGGLPADRLIAPSRPASRNPVPASASAHPRIGAAATAERPSPFWLSAAASVPPHDPVAVSPPCAFRRGAAVGPAVARPACPWIARPAAVRSLPRPATSAFPIDPIAVGPPARPATASWPTIHAFPGGPVPFGAPAGDWCAASARTTPAPGDASSPAPAHAAAAPGRPPTHERPRLR